jgi:hypothetical protein
VTWGGCRGVGSNRNLSYEIGTNEPRLSGVCRQQLVLLKPASGSLVAIRAATGNHVSNRPWLSSVRPCSTSTAISRA